MDVELGYVNLLMVLFLLGCLANDDMSYNIKSSSKRPLLPNNAVSMVIDATERMTISQLETTPSSIAIQWNFLKIDFNGTHQETVVGYISMNTNGRFISDNLGDVVNEFEFKHLQPDTVYSICVEVITVNIAETVSHFKCVNMKTIPTIRTDSIVAIFIAFGYLGFMGIVGCAVWKHRIHNINRNRFDEEVIEDGSSVRWKDIEEHQKLNSIEESVDV
ncbi:hypothetical protein SNE40_014387 [Patella caerulea]|uniref:Fibronectin type-III domain-containing protein n=1 Tax=Patella caerulea TaxID=87958 RepID=A0AAN8PCS7_PATCE